LYVCDIPFAADPTREKITAIRVVAAEILMFQSL
jgi:hypothetical protein